MAYIEIETPEGTKRVVLERDHLSIGRLSYNDIVLPVAQISRQHAEIRLVNGQWQIADTQSTNGIQHNGIRIHEHTLTNGDQFLLAPGITVTFYQGTAQPTSAASPTAASPTTNGNTSHPNWAQSFARQPVSPSQPRAIPPRQPLQPFRATPSSPLYAAISTASPGPTSPTAGPVMPASAPAAPAAPSLAAPFVSPTSVAPLRPRSVFADDEVPFVPMSMAATSPTPPPPPASRFSGNAAPPASFEPPARPAISSASIPAATSTTHPASQSAPQFTGGSSTPTAQTPPTGYPAPLGPMMPGADAHDLYHRSSAGPAMQRRTTSGPSSKLLHVCQTCGQRTAPDSVYCQSCHHTIAQECFNCRLSLLPIQDRCPRCHTPNAASVRRQNPHRAET